MTLTREEIEASVQSVPFWWHSIDLGGGLVTPGAQPQEFLDARLRSLQLPDMQGKTVLDIGAYDGFYSFAVERLGAARVVALNHYVWSLELPEHIKYWNECKERGIVPELYHNTPHWRPAELPGKRGYDTAHRALDSRVETVVADFMTADVSALGTFDVVLFLGVLYHLENPLQAVRRVFELTRELRDHRDGSDHDSRLRTRAVCEFYESNELNADVWIGGRQSARVDWAMSSRRFSKDRAANCRSVPTVSTRLKSTAKYLVAETAMEMPAKRLNPSRVPCDSACLEVDRFEPARAHLPLCWPPLCRWSLLWRWLGFWLLQNTTPPADGIATLEVADQIPRVGYGKALPQHWSPLYPLYLLAVRAVAPAPINRELLVTAAADALLLVTLCVVVMLVFRSLGRLCWPDDAAPRLAWLTYGCGLAVFLGILRWIR